MRPQLRAPCATSRPNSRLSQCGIGPGAHCLPAKTEVTNGEHTVTVRKSRQRQQTPAATGAAVVVDASLAELKRDFLSTTPRTVVASGAKLPSLSAVVPPLLGGRPHGNAPAAQARRPDLLPDPARNLGSNDTALRQLTQGGQWFRCQCAAAVHDNRASSRTGIPQNSVRAARFTHAPGPVTRGGVGGDLTLRRMPSRVDWGRAAPGWSLQRCVLDYRPALPVGEVNFREEQVEVGGDTHDQFTADRPRVAETEPPPEAGE